MVFLRNLIEKEFLGLYEGLLGLSQGLKRKFDNLIECSQGFGAKGILLVIIDSATYSLLTIANILNPCT